MQSYHGIIYLDQKKKVLISYDNKKFFVGYFLIGKLPKFDFLNPDHCLVYTVYTSFLTMQNIDFQFLRVSLLLITY